MRRLFLPILVLALMGFGFGSMAKASGPKKKKKDSVSLVIRSETIFIKMKVGNQKIRFPKVTLSQFSEILDQNPFLEEYVDVLDPDQGELSDQLAQALDNLNFGVDPDRILGFFEWMRDLHEDIMGGVMIQEALEGMEHFKEMKDLFGRDGGEARGKLEGFLVSFESPLKDKVSVKVKTPWKQEDEETDVDPEGEAEEESDSSDHSGLGADTNEFLKRFKKKKEEGLKTSLQDHPLGDPSEETEKEECDIRCMASDGWGGGVTLRFDFGGGSGGGASVSLSATTPIGTGHVAIDGNGDISAGRGTAPEPKTDKTKENAGQPNPEGDSIDCSKERNKENSLCQNVVFSSGKKKSAKEVMEGLKKKKGPATLPNPEGGEGDTLRAMIGQGKSIMQMLQEMCEKKVETAGNPGSEGGDSFCGAILNTNPLNRKRADLRCLASNSSDCQPNNPNL